MSDELEAIKERRAKIARSDLTVGRTVSHGNVNASQIYAGDKAICQMYNLPLHCGIDEMGDDPRVLEVLAYAQLFASAPSDVDWLIAEVERLREDARWPPDYVNQRVAQDCLAFLHAAGYGKPGSPTTLWAMVKAASEDVVRLREACKKALTCASLDSSVRSLVVAALAGDTEGEK
jgi:hypothetical protein